MGTALALASVLIPVGIFMGFFTRLFLKFFIPNFSELKNKVRTYFAYKLMGLGFILLGLWQICLAVFPRIIK